MDVSPKSSGRSLASDPSTRPPPPQLPSSPSGSPDGPAHPAIFRRPSPHSSLGQAQRHLGDPSLHQDPRLFQQTWNLKKSVGRRDKRRFRNLFENLEDSQCLEFQKDDSSLAEIYSDRSPSTMVETLRGLSPLRASRQLYRN